ncbi:MAG: sigma-70 family RNA polymerase sigma factor [Planctomycetaceae bacterium]
MSDLPQEKSTAGHMQEDTISSDTLLQARANNNAAWCTIDRVYHDRVFRQALRSGLGAQAAAELTHEVFSRAFENLPNFVRKGPGMGMGRWLNRMTFRMIVDRIRRRSKADRPLRDYDVPMGGLRGQDVSATVDREIPCDKVPANSSTESSGSGATMEKAALAAAIRDLEEDYAAQQKEHQWKCLWMVKVEGRSSAEVAEELNLSVTNVTSICHRVKERLKKAVLQKLEELRGSCGDAEQEAL